MSKLIQKLGKIKPIYFLLGWLFLNFIQIGFTELTSDEGYYWFYSQNLQWGYYDHPPMVSLLIKLGYSIFQNEFGVRIMQVLLMAIGLYFMFKTLKDEAINYGILYLILLSLPLFNYITFIAFPDTALVAISMIVLYVFKKILKTSIITDFILLGVLFSLMLYAKYHAVLFIAFLVLSQIRLLKNYKFYLSIIIAVVLYFPHLLWQYNNDFPSIIYHLQGRSEGFKISHVFEFLSQQLIILSPAIIFVPFVFKKKNSFDKTLIFISIGVFIFFLISTFKGFVHIHWLSVALFPFIVLAAKYYSDLKKRKLFIYLVTPFLIAIFLVRIYLIFNFIGVNKLGSDYYHDRKLWATDITQIAGKRYVLFEMGNASLREAPLYSFYSGNPSVALFPGKNKKSQYQLWNYEDSIQGQNVVLVKKDSFDLSHKLHNRQGQKLFYREINNFQSFDNIKFKIEKIERQLTETIIHVVLLNHRNLPLNILPKQEIILEMKSQKMGEKQFYFPFNKAYKILAKEKLRLPLSVPNQNLEEDTTLEIKFNDGVTSISTNSETYSLNLLL